MVTRTVWYGVLRVVYDLKDWTFSRVFSVTISKIFLKKKQKSEIISGKILVIDLDFAHNERKVAFIPSIDSSDADFYYPPNYGDETDPHINIKVGGATRFSKGSAIQMAAGYEGLGKGAASGGASIIYDVFSQSIGLNNTSSTHFMQWVHLIKPSPGCYY